MKSSGAVVSPVFGEGRVAYLSVCEAHREGGRVFREEARALRYALDHNDAYHHGHEPRLHGFDLERRARSDNPRQLGTRGCG